MPSGSPVPYLRKQGVATQLIVDGQPFLVLGGELHNSSSSSLAYLQPVWERLQALHLNTVLAAVTWELSEPHEGSFDWTLVDGLIMGARQHGLRLILLWFGSWKNGMSSYVPAWVKRDQVRFPRVRLANGQAVDVLSPLNERSMEADARAFATLMGHLREVDGATHTVLMVQVENEVGVLGASRDFSGAANAAFNGEVPSALLDHLVAREHELGAGLRQRWDNADHRSGGAWTEVWGAAPETDEIFMAWHYARYIDVVAEQGKAAYNLPLFVNAWLTGETSGDWPSGGDQPGSWPSGGPLPHTFDVWRAGAPHIDILAPDIYFGDFEQWCLQYTRLGNPLFVPEMRRDAGGVVEVFRAIGTYDALGTSPFGVDSIEEPDASPLASAYALLGQLAPLVLAHQGRGTMIGFVLDARHPSLVQGLGAYELHIAFDHGFGSTVEHAHGLIIADGADSFVGAGYGFRVTIRPIDTHGEVGILAVDEGSFDDGTWTQGRRLNGDETGSGKLWRFPAFGERTGVIPTVGPGTGISRCTVYHYGNT